MLREMVDAEKTAAADNDNDESMEDSDNDDTRSSIYTDEDITNTYKAEKLINRVLRGGDTQDLKIPRVSWWRDFCDKVRSL